MNTWIYIEREISVWQRESNTNGVMGDREKPGMNQPFFKRERKGHHIPLKIEA